MVDGDKGKRYALIAVAEYALSKRTQVYGTVDYNKVRDASTGDISGRTSQSRRRPGHSPYLLIANRDSGPPPAA